MADILDIETLFKLKVEELKLELGKRHLTKSGTKADLQERLLQYVNTHQSTVINYETESNAEPTEDEEKLKDELEESLDKPEMIIEDLVGTKFLNEDIIDGIPTPNDDNLSVTNNDGDNIDVNIDDDDDEDDIIGVKKVVQKNCVTADNSIDSITAIKDTDKKCTHSVKTEIPRVTSVKTVSLLTTNTEKKENRGKRFGGQSSETEKKKARLGRFFSSVSGLGKGEPVTEEDEEKIKKRVERFGAVSTILMPESSDRLKVRQERFADVNIKKRQERFGVVHKQFSDLNSDMEVRRQQRLLKFGALD